MKSAKLLTAALCLLLPSAYSDVTFQSSINDVYHRGTHELLGSLQSIVDNNDFEGATPQEPIFIKFTLTDSSGLENGAVLADTMVDLAAEDPQLSKPLFLAMKLLTTDERAILKAPATSLAIVRWVSGEPALWLRVDSDSSTWIQNGEGDVIPPDDAHKVSFTFGLSARTSAKNHENDDKSNLPFNSRNPAATETADAHSTLLCVDLNQSSVGSSGLPSLITLFGIPYGPEANTELGQYEATGALPINFTGSPDLGRGKDRQVAVTAGTTNGSSTRMVRNGNNAVITSSLSLELVNDDRPQFLKTQLVDGATLSLTAEGNTGLELASIRFLSACHGDGAITGEDAFEMDGKILYRRIHLNWNGGARELDRFQIDAFAALHLPVGISQADPKVAWQLRFVNHDENLDAAPFDGPHQTRRCKPSVFEAAQGQWRPAGASDEEKILSHITDPEGSFNTQIVITNTQSQEEPFLLRAYDPSGNHLATVADWIQPGNRRISSTSEIFGATEASHFAVAPVSGANVGATYRAKGENKVSVLVWASAQKSKSWRILPGNTSLTYDGLAMVNLGDEATRVLVTQLDESGNVIEQLQVEEALPVGAKLLEVLSLRFQPQQGARFQIDTTTPIAITALRGDWDSNLIWQTPATAVFVQPENEEVKQ